MSAENRLKEAAKTKNHPICVLHSDNHTDSQGPEYGFAINLAKLQPERVCYFKFRGEILSAYMVDGEIEIEVCEKLKGLLMNDDKRTALCDICNKDKAIEGFAANVTIRWAGDMPAEYGQVCADCQKDSISPE
jgi:hypothetical protein